MPDTARRGVYYRFSNHVVTGVNWRRTRLVDEIPSARVCCVCRTIPRRTVLLSCLHALCEDCHATNRQARSALCPLDQEPSEEDECVAVNFPSRKAESVKAGCSVSNASTTRNHSSSVSTELTTQSLNAAMEDLKTFLRDFQLDQLLPAIQSQMNELTEHVRNQEVLVGQDRPTDPSVRGALPGGWDSSPHTFFDTKPQILSTDEKCGFLGAAMCHDSIRASHPCFRCSLPTPCHQRRGLSKSDQRAIDVEKVV
ncbi:hypothetical protein HPB51_017233 [Rhipicephalus microplus]|uniref:RING-type domain-containing protein n=1 Tax=Rhipicephalus microplus TaxID=6941 RepID=A0A9J6EBL1_RHIMP|nr:hypothetical protein HPB51_017233 [Rhipicephalus microplus]